MEFPEIGIDINCKVCSVEKGFGSGAVKNEFTKKSIEFKLSKWKIDPQLFFIIVFWN